MLVAAGSDVRSRRLPNWLTLGGAGAGLFAQAVLRGGPGALDSALGWLLGVALLFIPFALRGMGAGDVKLLGAVGATRGASFVFVAFLFTAFVGGALSLLAMARAGTLLPALRGLGGSLYFGAVALFRYRMPPTLSLSLPGRTTVGESAGAIARLPYGVAIAAGTLLALALGY